jgi:multidrug efflux pump subunit AcrA (membrane-fusion protein)
VKRHAEVIELLVSEGDTVIPGQPLAVVEEREPTSEEYDALLAKYWDRGQRLRRHETYLRSPVSALAAWLRRLRGREEWPKIVEEDSAWWVDDE